jgi:hypothetical protein
VPSVGLLQTSSWPQQTAPQARMFGQQFPATQVWSSGQQVVGQARASGQHAPATQVVPLKHRQKSSSQRLSHSQKPSRQTSALEMQGQSGPQCTASQTQLPSTQNLPPGEQGVKSSSRALQPSGPLTGFDGSHTPSRQGLSGQSASVQQRSCGMQSPWHGLVVALGQPRQRRVFALQRPEQHWAPRAHRLPLARQQVPRASLQMPEQH